MESRIDAARRDGGAGPDGGNPSPGAVRERVLGLGLGLGLALGLFPGAPALAADTLCTADEVIVFSCHLDADIVSLCRPATGARSLAYRFGSQAGEQLVYPDPAKNESAGFSVSHGPSAGGDLTAVHFVRGGYEYTVYSLAVRARSGVLGKLAVHVEDGVTLSHLGRLQRKRICGDGGKGFREALDWLPGYVATK